MKLRLSPYLLLPLTAVTLCSCAFSLSISFPPHSNSTYDRGSEDYSFIRSEVTGDGFYRPGSINVGSDFTTFQDTCPTTGNIDILVLPIEFTDYPFSSRDIEDIKTLTGGTAEDTNYWESLGSFYEKSSYGNLKFSFTYAEKYSLGRTASQYYRDRNGLQDWSTYAIKSAVNSYKSKNGSSSTQKFDSNGDGNIDAVIALYSAPYTATEYPAINSIDPNGDCFWAFQYYAYEDPNRSSPTVNCYFWSSLYYFYEATGNHASHTGIDAHTLIHEMGHVLGADDYYNAENKNSKMDEPSGCKMMMSHNILDHDIFTKLAYGWTTPYVPTDSCEITLNPTTISGDCILLADSWNGTAFDEYVVLEFYTPTHLNYLDSHNLYPGRGYNSDWYGYTIPGIRAFHIDARLVQDTYRQTGGEWTYNSGRYLSDTEVTNGVDNVYLGNNSLVRVGTSNTYSYRSDTTKASGFNLIQMLSPRKSQFSFDNPAVNADLFKAGQSFTLDSSYHAYFPNGTKFNNGNALPFSFSVVSISDTEAKIAITKL